MFLRILSESLSCISSNFVYVGFCPDRRLLMTTPTYLALVKTSSSRQSEEPKKISVGIFEYILASMLKVFLNM